MGLYELRIDSNDNDTNAVNNHKKKKSDTNSPGLWATSVLDSVDKKLLIVRIEKVLLVVLSIVKMFI